MDLHCHDRGRSAWTGEWKISMDWSVDFLLQMELLITEHNFCVVTFAMEDLSRDYINNLKLEDRESRFVLVSRVGRDDFIRIIAPIKNGAFVFKVSFRIYGTQEWKHIEYACENIDGVAAFLDGFMLSSGDGSYLLDLYELGHEGGYRCGIISWEFNTLSDEASSDEIRTRLIQIRGAVKSLAAK